jgi:tetratricopeptide (TPR) repeat protein
MRDLDDLLARAVPRLAKGDKKAQKLKSRLVKLAAAYWKRGPKRLEKLGVKVRGDLPSLDASDADAFLAGAHEALGDKGFVRFMSGVKKELAKKLAEKKGEALRAKPKAKPKPKPADVPAELTMSDEGPVEGGGLDLALPEDSDDGLAIPGEDELSIPDLGGDDEDGHDAVPEVDLDALEIMGDVGGPAAAPAAEEEAKDETDPDRALASYRRTGDPKHLEKAKELFKKAAKAAKNPVARGAARGGLAEVYLIAGSLDKAKDQAKKALKDFPAAPAANAVLCRAEWPKEAERERLAASLRQAEAKLDRSDWDGAKAAAKALKKAFPKEPFWALVLLAVACETRKGFDAALGQAWKLYPASEDFADVLPGNAIEEPIMRRCIDWLQDEIKEKGGDVLGQTVKEVTSKSNVVAGAFQIPLGLARAAVAGRGAMDSSIEQQLRVWAGHAIFLSQHYDHAKDVYTAARKLDREGGLIPEIQKGETQCGVMKRSFDKPGVKHRGGKFDGVGVEAYRKAVTARLQRASGAAEGDRKKLDAKETALLEAILADEGRKKKLQKRAKKAGQDDPFAALDALEAEVGAAKEEAPKKGGFLGRMKAAANKALDKAKGAMAAGKRKAALKALGEALRDRPDGGWKDADLDALLEKLDKVEPRLSFLEEEAGRMAQALAKADDLT